MIGRSEPATPTGRQRMVEKRASNIDFASRHHFGAIKRPWGPENERALSTLQPRDDTPRPWWRRFSSPWTDNKITNPVKLVRYFAISWRRAAESSMKPFHCNNGPEVEICGSRQDLRLGGALPNHSRVPLMMPNHEPRRWRSTYAWVVNQNYK